MISIVLSNEQHFNTLEEQQEMAAELLREEMQNEYHLDVDWGYIRKNAWGKPYLSDRPDIHYSISHCRGGVALSVSSGKTGIDIENVRAFSMTTARKVLSDDEMFMITRSVCPEREFFKLWTLKESYVKAVGTGLSYPLKNISFSIDQDLTVQCNRKGCLFCIFEKDPRFVAAVCCLTKEDRIKETVRYRVLP